MSENYINDLSADADLLTRVGIALTLRLRHTLHAVHIQVDKGTVTLRGMVPTFYDRQLAIEVTRRVAGVYRVFDEITVAGSNDGTKGRHIESAHARAATNTVRGAGTETARRSSAAAVARRPKPVRSWRSLLTNAATYFAVCF